MKNNLLINTILDQPQFLESFVEKLAYRHYDIGYGKALVPKNFIAIETSSTETYISGTVAISEKDEVINMPFITPFLFTCTKEKDGPYKLFGSFSLS